MTCALVVLSIVAPTFIQSDQLGTARYPGNTRSLAAFGAIVGYSAATACARRFVRKPLQGGKILTCILLPKAEILDGYVQRSYSLPMQWHSQFTGRTVFA